MVCVKYIHAAIPPIQARQAPLCVSLALAEPLRRTPDSPSSSRPYARTKDGVRRATDKNLQFGEVPFNRF